MTDEPVGQLKLRLRVSDDQSAVNLNEVASWASGDRDLTPSAETAVTRLVTTHKPRLDTSMVVLAMRRVARLSRMMGISDRIEERLFSEDLIDRHKDDPMMLSKIWTSVQTVLENDSAFMERFTKLGVDSRRIEDLVRQLGSTGVSAPELTVGSRDALPIMKDMSPDRRQTVLDVMSSLAKVVVEASDESGIVDVTPTRVLDDESDGTD